MCICRKLLGDVVYPFAGDYAAAQVPVTPAMQQVLGHNPELFVSSVYDCWLASPNDMCVSLIMPLRTYG